ncbi:MAG: precorrin-3B C(17)-methyltransferase [Caulobacteraceae bacterium]
MSGRIYIIGMGPGADAMRTPEADHALAQATDLVGYSTYVARVPERFGQRRHISDNREELARARHALTLAMEGATVAVCSSGDAGVFAMAAAVFEAVDHGDPAWRALEIEVVAGVSAMFAVAARLGAPLGGDFCGISLSDNLKPWPVVLKRLRVAAEAGFAMALYNPLSRARPWQLGAAFDVLREVLPPSTPVAFAAAVGRSDESLRVVDLAAADPAWADMRTLVLVGAATTRRIDRENARPWIYTPRSVAPEL